MAVRGRRIARIAASLPKMGRWRNDSPRQFRDCLASISFIDLLSVGMLSFHPGVSQSLIELV